MSLIFPISMLFCVSSTFTPLHFFINLLFWGFFCHVTVIFEPLAVVGQSEITDWLFSWADHHRKRKVLSLEPITLVPMVSPIYYVFLLIFRLCLFTKATWYFLSDMFSIESDYISDSLCKNDAALSEQWLIYLQSKSTLTLRSFSKNAV